MGCYNMKMFKGNIEFKGELKLINMEDYFILLDKHDNIIYIENHKGYWCKYRFDKNNNKVYHKSYTGFWYKVEYDNDNNKVYFENSEGYIEDNRPKKKAGCYNEKREIRKLYR